MALNFFVHFVVDVAVVLLDFVMELHIAAVHTLVDSVVAASPIQKRIIQKNYFSGKSNLEIKRLKGLVSIDRIQTLE